MSPRHGFHPPGLVRLAALALAMLLQGCALPRSAPTLGEMQSPDVRLVADVVSVTAADVAAGLQPDHASFPAALLGQPTIDVERLGAGDVIAITVWEHDGLGLFPASANGTAGAADLGEFTVDRRGTISLPYAGAITVAGLTPTELHAAIARKLARLIMTPQVAVRMVQRHSLAVTVQGDVAKPGTFAIDLASVRLSGLLGMVAPNQQNPEQLAVTVRRAGIGATVRLSDLYASPEQDIALRGGDSIIVHAVTERVTVLGATGIQGQVPITRRNFSVIDAIGGARGLNDAAADPRAVFLLRNPAAQLPGGAAVRPTIYQFDLRRPEQLLLASRFVARDKDILLVSDAPFTQTQKLLSAFSAALSAVRPMTDVAS